MLGKLPSQNEEFICSRRLVSFALYVLQKLMLLSSLLQEKSYSFGHPSIDTVVIRYLLGCNYTSQNVIGAHPHIKAHVRDLNRQYTEAINELEAEKKRVMELKKVKRESRNQHWWEKPIKELGLQELELLKAAMDKLKVNVADRADELLIKDSHFMPTTNPIGTSSTTQHRYPFEPNTNHLHTSVVPNHGYGYGFGFGRPGPY
ncbi:hypothetical protein BVC80_8117g10 [Macleaya cordata]|uniref:Uncharacterized protein n=1 Tax=Macleaya cordata TaxID=56857 RepID=A0A200PYB0_MACCD|nr:hypothetical protein BVC80_8117g10 [Macleaya cordata]